MIYTLGETLMDIIVDNNGEAVVIPGGAMLNVAVSLARRSCNVALISELGEDRVGANVKRFLEEAGADAKYTRFYAGEKTSLALAFLDKQAKPSYSFYKSYPENRSLITSIPFKNGDFLLFGSVYSLDAAIREDVLSIVNGAKKQGVTVVYDPNIRHAHHLGNVEMEKALYQNIALADIVKGSDEDFTNIFGKGDARYWKQRIAEINKNAVVIVTLGAQGAVLFTRDKTIEIEAQKIEVVSTVGAGDAFSAGLLKSLSDLKIALPEISITQWHAILNIAVAFSAEVCKTKKNYVGKRNK